MGAAENRRLSLLRVISFRQISHERPDFLFRRHTLDRARQAFARHFDDLRFGERAKDAFFVTMRRNRSRCRKDRHARHFRERRKIEAHPDDRHRFFVKRRRHVERNGVARDDDRFHVLRQKKLFPFFGKTNDLLPRPLAVWVSLRITEIHHRFFRVPRFQDAHRGEPAGS